MCRRRGLYDTDASDLLEAGEPALSIYQWALLREYPSPKSSQTGHYYRAWWKRDVRPEEFDKVFHKKGSTVLIANSEAEWAIEIAKRAPDIASQDWRTMIELRPEPREIPSSQKGVVLTAVRQLGLEELGVRRDRAQVLVKNPPRRFLDAPRGFGCQLQVLRKLGWTRACRSSKTDRTKTALPK